MPMPESTERKIINLKQLQVIVLKWADENRLGWRDRTFKYIGIDSARPISEAIMRNQAVAQQIQELDNSIRSAADLEAVLRRHRPNQSNKWLPALFQDLRNLPKLLKGGIKNEEDGLGPFAGLSPADRDAKKREIWDWKLSYINYLERKDREEVQVEE